MHFRRSFQFCFAHILTACFLNSVSCHGSVHAKNSTSIPTNFRVDDPEEAAERKAHLVHLILAIAGVLSLFFGLIMLCSHCGNSITEGYVFSSLNEHEPNNYLTFPPETGKPFLSNHAPIININITNQRKDKRESTRKTARAREPPSSHRSL